MINTVKNWSISTLFNRLKETELATSGNAEITLIEGEKPAIHIVMRAYGDLPLFLSLSGEQILIEAALWPASKIDDIPGFNDTILRTHKFFPLSTISLDTMNSRGDYYHMYGSLSAASSLQDIVFEIQVLASNVIQATAAYSGFLRSPAEA